MNNQHIPPQSTKTLALAYEKASDKLQALRQVRADLIQHTKETYSDYSSFDFSSDLKEIDLEIEKARKETLDCWNAFCCSDIHSAPHLQS